MPTSLTPEALRTVFDPLADALRDIAVEPEPRRRQPVHVVYGGAHLFRFDTARKLGRLALDAFDDAFADDETFARELELRADPAVVRERVRAKVQREPVEDLRVDFEDGYGPRPDAEEDAHAEAVARELARGHAEGTLPPSIGIRVKALTGELHARAARTLDLVLTSLVQEAGTLPAGFRVTLPKVQVPAQVEALATLLDRLEERLGLARGSTPVELMLETPQALVGADGRVALPGLVAAARGRCSAVHLGSYDLTAALGIAAEHQTLAHPACDFAKHLLQVALAGTGVELADGATTVLPIPRHRAAAGTSLTDQQREENRTVVRAAARLHARNVRHGIAGGYWQGWDLHPAQIPVRFAVLHDFFRASLPAAAARLRQFLAAAAQATRVGAVFDDAATGQGLLNFFVRGVACGALGPDDLASAGITAEELAHRSFARLLAARASA